MPPGLGPVTGWVQASVFTHTIAFIDHRVTAKAQRFRGPACHLTHRVYTLPDIHSTERAVSVDDTPSSTDLLQVSTIDQSQSTDPTEGNVEPLYCQQTGVVSTTSSATSRTSRVYIASSVSTVKPSKPCVKIWVSQ